VKGVGPSPFLYLHAQSRRKVQLRFRLQGVDDVECETCVLVAITTISRYDYAAAVRYELNDGMDGTDTKEHGNVNNGFE
jgi:hypothetical protein